MGRTFLIRALLASLAAVLVLAELGAAQAEETKKKRKDLSTEQTYERKLPETYAPFGPYTIRNLQDGKIFEGRVTVSVEAINSSARQMLWGNKPLVNGILFPLAVKLFEGGRPTPSRVEGFKKEAQTALDARFKGQIKGVYVKDVMG
ncbi:MAG: hypothetical protein HYR63_03200 [Proteobacteria bacterium]|nr:hypothetical protein [Pseudomonadota bacterium]MBI3495754.1 hypothetical protein [Pseudomonadota bacterium]